jgi:Amidohydrolase family
MSEWTPACITSIAIAATFALLSTARGHPLQARSGNPAASVAITHVTVLPMDRERTLVDQTVITHGELIASIGPAAGAAIPRGATVIDAHGAYLMPGLTDMHVHLRDPEELLSDLVWGVTTVAAFSGGPQTLRWRAAVNQGHLIGPTIYTTAPILDGVPPINSTHIQVGTAAEAKTVVDFEKEAGYDYVKVYNNIKPDVYHAIMMEAKAQGIPVVGHIVRAVGAEQSLREGQRVIAHAEEYYFSYFNTRPDTAKIPAIVAETKAAGAWVVAMLSSTPDILGIIANIDSEMAFPEARYLPPAVFESYRPANNSYYNRPNLPAFVAQNRVMAGFLSLFVKALSDAQVPLLVGTDATSLNFPGWAAHIEIRDLVAAGLTPYQALRAATFNAGTFVSEYVRPADRFGTIAPGMRADLLLLSANPLANIANIDSITGVMARGRWRTIGELRRLRDQAATAYPHLKAQVVRFDTLVTTGRIPAARAVFDSAVRADQGEPPFHEYMLYGDGLGLLQRNPVGALDLMRMAVQLYPDGFETHNGLGRALLTIHDTAGARAEFSAAARLAPGNDVSLRMLDSLGRE